LDEAACRQQLDDMAHEVRELLGDTRWGGAARIPQISNDMGAGMSYVQVVGMLRAVS
jgi:hypothetical protein